MSKVALRVGMAAPQPLLDIARKLNKNGAGVTIENINANPMRLFILCNLENITQEEEAEMKKNEIYLGVANMDGVPFFVARMGKMSFDVVLQDLPKVSTQASAMICVMDPADEYRIKYLDEIELPSYIIEEINDGVAPLRDLPKDINNAMATKAQEKYTSSDLIKSGLFYAARAKTAVRFS